MYRYNEQPAGLAIDPRFGLSPEDEERPALDETAAAEVLDALVSDGYASV